ncbi:acyltransferase domain-containing protein, partial [Streptomyces xinghaiensis]
MAGRSRFGYRAVVLARGEAELAGRLRALAGGDPDAGVVTGAVVDPETGSGGGGVVLVFPGQGTQWVGMGAGLLGSSEVFAASMRECARAL